jgi:hypothetical protein
MMLHGVASVMFPAMLSIVFAGLWLSGNRAEQLVIARYRRLQALSDEAATTGAAEKLAILRLLAKSLWALWFVLLASCLVLPLAGDLNLSRSITKGMILLLLVMTPVRIFIAAALFWPRRNDRRHQNCRNDVKAEN